MNDVGFRPGPVTRPVGLETEFGVLRPGDAYANPVVLSTRVVEAYCAGSGVPTVRWDYEGEDPLADLRGGRLRRSAAHALGRCTVGRCGGDGRPSAGPLGVARSPQCRRGSPAPGHDCGPGQRRPLLRRPRPPRVLLTRGPHTPRRPDLGPRR